MRLIDNYLNQKVIIKTGFLYVILLLFFSCQSEMAVNQFYCFLRFLLNLET